MLDFIITGLPGTGSCFWSYALTQGTTSFCSHEYEEGEGPPPPSASIYGDVSASYLFKPKPTKKWTVIHRSTEDAMKSYLKRYPTQDTESVAKQFDEMAARVQVLRFKPAVLTIDYEPMYKEETIRKVFLHSTNMQIHPHRLDLLTKTQILKHE